MDLSSGLQCLDNRHSKEVIGLELFKALLANNLIKTDMADLNLLRPKLNKIDFIAVEKNVPPPAFKEFKNIAIRPKKLEQIYFAPSLKKKKNILQIFVRVA